MRSLLLAILFWSVALLSGAQPGALDATFNPSDVGLPNGVGANGYVQTIAVQSDGRILIGGDFTTYNGYASNRIARLAPNGSLDNATFHVGSGANGPVYAIVPEANGNIFIGGAFTDYKGNWYRDFMAQVNNGGGIEADFSPVNGANGGDGPTGTVRAIVRQSDGKVLIGGSFITYNGVPRNYLARLESDGSLDPSFNPGSGPNNPVTSILVQGNGKILIIGEFTSYNGTPRSYLARLNPDGSIDPSFNAGSGANGMVHSMAFQNDGQLLIGGAFTAYNGTPRNRIARLNPDGTLDPSFNPGGGANGVIHALAIQSDGKILVGGDFTAYNNTARNRIARLRTNGNLDASFDPGGGANNSILSIALQSDGKILIGGQFTSYNNTSCTYFTRLNADGSLETSFNPGSGANGTIRSIACLGPGRILIAGDFTAYNGASRNAIAQLYENGNAEPLQFGSGANNSVRVLAMQRDGDILIGGDFTSFNGMPRNRIAWTKISGAPGVTFNPGTGTNGSVYAIAFQEDEKILIGGNFTTYKDTARIRIARLNGNGTLDLSFNPGTGPNDVVTSVAVQRDGKILIGGYFTSYNGTARNHLARLNPDGSLDAFFDPGKGANSGVECVAVQADGRILVGGQFTSYNGTSRNYLVRLSTDGNVDASFNPGSGANGAVRSMALQTDGRILIGGAFTTYNGAARNNIAQVQADGSLDASFNAGSALNNAVHAIALQNDGKVLAGGAFTTGSSGGRTRLARLHKGAEPLILGAVPTGPYCAGSDIPVPFTATGAYCNGNALYVELSNSMGSFSAPLRIGEVTDLGAGLLTGTIAATIPIDIAPGNGYRVRIVNNVPDVISLDNGTNLTLKAMPDTPVITPSGPAAFCTGSGVVLSSSASSGNQWYLDSVAISGATAPSYTAVQAGRYSVTTTQNACASGMSPEVKVSVSPAPAKPVVTQNGNTLSSSSASGNQWLRNGTPIAGATTQLYVALSTGLYSVQVTQNGCSTQSDAVNVVVTAVVDPTAWNGEVTTYPNPVQDQLFIINAKGRRLTVQLVDLAGKKIYERHVSATSISLSLKEVSQGAYLLLITDVKKGETISKTIVKQ